MYNKGNNTKERKSKMKALLLESRRDGYSPDQIFETMTVGELISFLQDFDEDTPIYTSHDNGYTFGGITTDDFREENVDDEE